MQRYPLRMSDVDRLAIEAGRDAFECAQVEMEGILMPDYRPPAYTGLQPGQVVRAYQAQGVELFRRSKELLLGDDIGRSEEHTSALQSLMRSSYAVVCVKKKITKQCVRTRIIRN